MKPRGRPPLGEVTSIRFPDSLALALRQTAAREGKNITEWVREVVGAEVARREGRCPTCGQTSPSNAGEGPASSSGLAD